MNVVIKFNSVQEGLDYILNSNNNFIFKVGDSLHNPDGSLNNEELIFNEEYNFGSILLQDNLLTSAEVESQLFIEDNILKYYK